MLVLEYKAVVKKHQTQAIEEAIRTSQFVRNKVLRYWMDNRGIGKKELYRYNTQLREEFEWVKHLNSHACQASVENVERAIKRFLDNCKKQKPGKKGYPKFKKHSRSVEYKQSGWKLHPTLRRIQFTDKKGIGEFKLLGKWDIHTITAGNVKLIKRVRIVRRADGYYVQFVLKPNPEESYLRCRGSRGLHSIVPKTEQVGIDVGLEYFYSDSNGNHVENPRFLRKAEESIKRSQRKIYRKNIGSSGRKKARGVYARKHLRVTRQRNEHAKRLARNLCLSNDRVVLEDLNVSGLVRNHKLAKSIADASWYNFRQWLEYFGQKLGCEVIAIPPHYTSTECSNCGAKVQKSLSTRTHRCPDCGYTAQRDVNAAKVILKRGTNSQATGGHPESNASRVEVTTNVGRKTCKSKHRQ